MLFIPYKEGTSGPIVLLGWTLNCEMVFYGIMALCIFFVKNKKCLTLAAVLILTAFIVILNKINSNIYILQFYHKRALFLEFIYGIMIYHFYNYIDRRDKKDYNLFLSVLILFIGLFSFLFLIFSDITGFRVSNNRSIQQGIPALIVVTSILLLEKYIKNNHFLVQIGLRVGDASYVMYLFHPFFIYFFQRLVFQKIIRGSDNIMIKIIEIIIELIIVITGSIYLYRYIDEPVQKGLRWLMIGKKQRHFV
jgi:peptidoglycan/LPS O-acetylase OafA/YrhL